MNHLYAIINTFYHHHTLENLSQLFYTKVNPTLFDYKIHRTSIDYNVLFDKNTMGHPTYWLIYNHRDRIFSDELWPHCERVFVISQNVVTTTYRHDYICTIENNISIIDTEFPYRLYKSKIEEICAKRRLVELKRKFNKN